MTHAECTSVLMLFYHLPRDIERIDEIALVLTILSMSAV